MVTSQYSHADAALSLPSLPPSLPPHRALKAACYLPLCCGWQDNAVALSLMAVWYIPAGTRESMLSLFQHSVQSWVLSLLKRSWNSMGASFCSHTLTNLPASLLIPILSSPLIFSPSAFTAKRAPGFPQLWSRAASDGKKCTAAVLEGHSTSVATRSGGTSGAPGTCLSCCFWSVAPLPTISLALLTIPNSPTFCVHACLANSCFLPCST